MRRTTPAHERVLARIVESDTWFGGSPCWVYTGGRNPNGYGQVLSGSRLNGTRRMVKTHRVMYEALVGPIPEGLGLDHLCRVRSCCNPKHLEPVPHRINMLRGNTIAAAAAAKTHCPSGHPYSDENTYRYPSGRKCRTCVIARVAAYQARKKASADA